MPYLDRTYLEVGASSSSGWDFSVDTEIQKLNPKQYARFQRLLADATETAHRLWLERENHQ